LAVVANTMAVVKHLEHVKFMKSNMERKENNLDDVRFLLNDKIYSLKPFWDRVMMDARQRRYGTLSQSEHLLEHMRQEYMEIVDEIAMDFMTDDKLFREVQQVLKQIPEAARREEETSDSDSEGTIQEYSGEEDIYQSSLDERKPIAVGETDAKNRVEAAKPLHHCEQSLQQ
jgi:hypothetical protein